MNNEKKMNEMLNKKVWAVIGATPNTEKTANRIYHTLKKYGYETYAVNPNYSEMEDGTKCYACLEDLPKVPDCIDFVIPPSVTLKSLEEMDPETYPNIWLQPGTYDKEIVSFAESKGFKVVHEGACAMAAVRLRQHARSYQYPPIKTKKVITLTNCKIITPLIRPQSLKGIIILFIIRL